MFPTSKPWAQQTHAHHETHSNKLHCEQPNIKCQVSVSVGFPCIFIFGTVRIWIYFFVVKCVIYVWFYEIYISHVGFGWASIFSENLECFFPIFVLWLLWWRWRVCILKHVVVVVVVVVCFSILFFHLWIILYYIYSCLQGYVRKRVMEEWLRPQSPRVLKASCLMSPCIRFNTLLPLSSFF